MGGKLMSAFQIYDALPCTLNVDFVPAETLWKANRTAHQKMWGGGKMVQRDHSQSATTIKATYATYFPPLAIPGRQTFDVLFCSSPSEWQMDIIFVQPWSCESEYQSSTSPNRTNKSDGVAGIHLEAAGDESVYKKCGILSPSQCDMNPRVIYSSIVKTYSYHTLKKMTLNLSTLLEMERLLFQAYGSQAAFQQWH